MTHKSARRGPNAYAVDGDFSPVFFRQPRSVGGGPDGRQIERSMETRGLIPLNART